MGGGRLLIICSYSHRLVTAVCLDCFEGLRVPPSKRLVIFSYWMESRLAVCYRILRNKRIMHCCEHWGRIGPFHQHNTFRTQLSFKEATRGLGACCSWQATVAKLGGLVFQGQLEGGTIEMRSRAMNRNHGAWVLNKACFWLTAYQICTLAVMIMIVYDMRTQKWILLMLTYDTHVQCIA